MRIEITVTDDFGNETFSTEIDHVLKSVLVPEGQTSPNLTSVAHAVIQKIDLESIT